MSTEMIEAHRRLRRIIRHHRGEAQEVKMKTCFDEPNAKQGSMKSNDGLLMVSSAYVQGVLKQAQEAEAKVKELSSEADHWKGELIKATEEFKALNNFWICAYCGNKFPKDAADGPMRVADHTVSCKKSPLVEKIKSLETRIELWGMGRMDELEVELAKERARIKALEEGIKRLRSIDTHPSHEHDYIDAKRELYRLIEDGPLSD